MADYILKTIDVVKDKAVETVRTVINSSTVKQLWSAAEDFKQKWSTGDDFVDGSANPFGNSTAKAASDIFNVFGDSDSSGNKELSQRAQQAQATITERIFSDEVLDICMKVLLLVFILTLASFTANSMIFYPSILRFFTFIVVVVGCWFFDSAFTLVTCYYLFYMITAFYMNSSLAPGEPRHKLIPHLYSFLPLRTRKYSGWLEFFLFPITYFHSGENGIGYKYYKFQEQDYVDSIKEQIPSWNKIKETLGVPALLSEFIEHLEAMNAPYKIIKDESGNDVMMSAQVLSASMSAAELLKEYKKAVNNKNVPIRTKIMKQLLNKFVSDSVTNQDTALIKDFETFEESLVQKGYLEEAEEVARLLLSIYQSTKSNNLLSINPTGNQNTDRGVASNKADEARARLFKVLEKRKSTLAAKGDALDKEIAYGKANRIDMKTKEAERKAITQKLTGITEEADKLGRKIRFSSTLPTYDVEGKDLSKEIGDLITDITTRVRTMSGGASATAAATPAAPAAPDSNATPLSEPEKELLGKFEVLNQRINENEGIDWAELTSAKKDIQRLQELQEVLAKEVKRLQELRSDDTTVLQDLHVKEAELAGIAEDIEHELSTISRHTQELYKKATVYRKLQGVLKGKTSKLCLDEGAKLEARLKPIDDLYKIVNPPAKINQGSIQAVLEKIPVQANVSGVTFTPPKNTRGRLTKMRNSVVAGIGSAARAVGSLFTSKKPAAAPAAVAAAPAAVAATPAVVAATPAVVAAPASDAPAVVAVAPPFPTRTLPLPVGSAGSRSVDETIRTLEDENDDKL